VYEAVGVSRETHCDACFTGQYPLEGTEDANGKYDLELPLLKA
jgi:amidophosphoribosyltransferase